MRCPTVLADILYRAARPAACVASPFLPVPMHPGKRAHRAVTALKAIAIDTRFAWTVLESCCKSYLLHRHLSQLHRAALQSFLEQRVEWDGAITSGEISNETRPIIFAAPHYGEPLAGAVTIAHLLSRSHRPLNIFHDQQRHGARLKLFFRHCGLPPSVLLGGLGGVRSALRALERGECLALLPDAFDDIKQTVVVPFLGRLLRVASGTAFLAVRSHALIVPVFAIPGARLGLRMIFGQPIDPARVATEDESQAIFTLMHLLFSRIEAQLQLSPEHWRYWEVLPHVSTPLGTPLSREGSQLLEALKAKFHALPPALQDIPELELLLE